MSHRCKGYNCTINLPDGDRRLYCSPKCRQSAYRARKEQESPKQKEIKRLYGELAIKRNGLLRASYDLTPAGNDQFERWMIGFNRIKEYIIELENSDDEDFLEKIS